MQARRNFDIGILVILLLVTAGLFLRIKNHEFINYDDQLYITSNLRVLQGLTVENVKWAFGNLTGNGTYWHPLTWISHFVDCAVFGVQKDSQHLGAGGHHLVSLVWHLANVTLLFLLLKKLTGTVWRSAIVAALFAWHPLQVDTVAWIAERKNLLGTFFGLLTIFVYARFVEAPPHRRKILYPAALLLFACSLMSKPIFITLPFALLLLDIWPLRRTVLVDEERTSPAPFANLVTEKLPFLALSILSGVIMILAHRKLELVTSVEKLTLTHRLANAAVAYFSYVRKVFWPDDLSVYYPLPERWPALLIAFASLFVIGISFVAVRTYRTRPYLAVGWFWFLGTLVPFIGIMQVNDQAMADRFAYVPLIGLFVAIVWGAADVLGRFGNATAVRVISAGALGAAAFATYHQVTHWQSSETLFRHALQVTKNNNIAHINLGAALESRGDLEGAKEQYESALRVQPLNSMAESNLGVILAKMGRLNDAFPHFQKAVEINPENADAHSNLGLALTYSQRTSEAIAEFKKAIHLKPDHADAHHNLANALSQSNQQEEALSHYQAALQLKPRNFDAHNNYGFTLYKLGRLPEAETQFLAALELMPNQPNAHYNLGLICLKSSRTNDARNHFAAAATAKPNFAEAHYQLGLLLKDAGDETSANEHLRRAAELKPEFGKSE